MSHGETASTVLSLLLGVLTSGTPAVATAADGPQGPVAAIEKARAVADAAGSERVQKLDSAASASLGSPVGGGEQGTTEAPPSATEGRVETRTVEPAVRPGANAAGTEPQQPAQAPAPAVAPRDAQAGIPAAQLATASPGGKYDPNAHRDPFRPPNLASASAENGPRTPLEGYEIGQLKLVGIIQDQANARAMVEDSAGLGYIVTAGTPIGSSGGIVRTIESRRLLIEETTTNFYGEKQPKEVVMELPQEDRSP